MLYKDMQHMEDSAPISREQWVALAHARAQRMALASEEELDRLYPTRHAVANEIQSFQAVMAVCEFHASSGRLDEATMVLWREAQNCRQAVDRLRLRLNPLAAPVAAGVH